jgi:hypothetical protein
MTHLGEKEGQEVRCIFFASEVLLTPSAQKCYVYMLRHQTLGYQIWALTAASQMILILLPPSSRFHHEKNRFQT